MFWGVPLPIFLILYLNFVERKQIFVEKYWSKKSSVVDADPEWFIPDPDLALNFPSSGSGYRPKFRIHADPDPQHWKKWRLSPLFFLNFFKTRLLKNWRSYTRKCLLKSSVVDPDPNGIRIQDLCGSGSIFRIPIQIHTGKYRIN